jgi:hypothetical protein
MDVFQRDIIFENIKLRIKSNIAIQFLPQFLNPSQTTTEKNYFISKTPLITYPDTIPKSDII